MMLTRSKAILLAVGRFLRYKTRSAISSCFIPFCVHHRGSRIEITQKFRIEERGDGCLLVLRLQNCRPAR